MGDVTRFVFRRLALMVPTFVGISVLTFAVAHWAPGDPFQLDPEAVSGSAWASSLHSARTDEAALVTQYARWLSRVVRADFGSSAVDQRPVMSKVAEALPATVQVTLPALVLGYGLAVPLGVWLATSRRRFARVVEWVVTAAGSVPTFWLAVLALLAFASPAGGLEWFPLQGIGGVRALVLPVAVLTVPTLTMASRQVETSMRTALDSDYVFAARARRLPERRVVWGHALRNSLLPVLTLLGLSLPHVLGGSVVVERVFGVPGMGLLAFDAIGARDYPTVMGVATVMALATMASMLAVDLLYGLIDPRIRSGERLE